MDRHHTGRGLRYFRGAILAALILLLGAAVAGGHLFDNAQSEGEMEKVDEHSETTLLDQTMLDQIDSKLVAIRMIADWVAAEHSEAIKSRDRWKAAWESTNLQLRALQTDSATWRDEDQRGIGLWKAEAESWRAKCCEAEALNKKINASWSRFVFTAAISAVIAWAIVGLLARGRWTL